MGPSVCIVYSLFIIVDNVYHREVFIIIYRSAIYVIIKFCILAIQKRHAIILAKHHDFKHHDFNGPECHSKLTVDT